LLKSGSGLCGVRWAICVFVGGKGSEKCCGGTNLARRIDVI
jgi:hypothetical protein